MKIFKIKKDKVDVLRDWGREVSSSLKEEAILSLKEENCTHEVFQIFEIDGEFYAVMHMEGDDILPANPDREINKKHRAILQECIEKEISTEVLYDIASGN